MENKLSVKIEIKDRIHNLRGKQVMIDRDLAELYDVPTKRINEQVKRNKERFPEEFMFSLSKQETNELVAKCDRFERLKHSTSTIKAFTEQGVAMLSSILKSRTAIEVSIQIMNSFVEMRRFLKTNNNLFKRLSFVEQKVIEQDNSINKILFVLKDHEPEKGIFFEGELFDAHKFISSIIKQAKKSIILIDNFVDETTLTILDKRKQDVQATIYTRKIDKKLKLDLEKYNKQYPPIQIIEFNKSHDRFLIIDNTTTYHIGASIKDLGKKWFAFSKFNKESVTILERIKIDKEPT